MCLCAAVLSPEHALYSVQRATRGVCEGISLNDDGRGSDVRGRVSAHSHMHTSVLLLSANLVSLKVNFSETKKKKKKSASVF